MNVGFCGLGQMGAPMAARLLQAKHRVVVWNRSPEKAGPLLRRGAEGASSPAEAASGVDVVVTMLASLEAVEDVVFGDAGIAHGLRRGATLVEMSTIGPDAARAVAERLPKGVEMVDAPVLGSVPEAEEGALQIFAGAKQETFERFRGMLSALGQPVRIGPLASGAAMKLVVNSVLGAIQLAFGEALALSDALGLDAPRTLDVLEGSPIGATIKKKRQKLATGVFEPNFKLSLAAKDMRLVSDAARATGRELSGAEAACAAFESAAAAGWEIVITPPSRRS